MSARGGGRQRLDAFDLSTYGAQAVEIVDGVDQENAAAKGGVHLPLFLEILIRLTAKPHAVYRQNLAELPAADVVGGRLDDRVVASVMADECRKP